MPSNAPSSSSSLRNLLIWVGVFAGCYALWAVVFLPALTQPWWFADDFWMMERMQAGQSGEIYTLAHSAGRPITALLFLLHPWAMDMAHPGGALAVRLFQGAGHCLTAVLLARLFSRYLPLWKSTLCALPFLLWGFNPESVLWFGGIQHVFGALFAVAGYMLILNGVEHHRWWQWLIGGLLCTAAMLANQNPAGVALLLWLMVLAFRELSAAGTAIIATEPATTQEKGTLRGPFSYEKLGRWLDIYLAQPIFGRFSREGIHLFWGLGIGAVVTLLMVHHYSYNRAQGTIDWLGKLKFLGQLNNYTFFWPEFYPTVLTWAGVALIATVLCGVVWAVYQGKRRLVLLITLLLFLAGGAVLPYFANLLIPMNWASFRILYIGPMFISMLCALGFLLWQRVRTGQVAMTIILVLIAYHYAWLGRHNAPNYPALYQDDLATLHRIEAFAKEKGVYKVLVLAGPNSPWPYVENPYGIRYYHLDGFRSNFHTPWTPHAFIRLHSKILNPENGEAENNERIKKYFAYASAMPLGEPHFRITLAPDDPGLILVIPR